LCLGQNTSSTPQSSSKPPAKSSQGPDPGSVTSGVYRNPTFDFTYKFPAGWVDRTDRMQDVSEEGKSVVLLALFEHPPEATPEGADPAIVIAAEKATAYPGLKTATDYFEPLTAASTAQGFKVVNEPYLYTRGETSLARSDLHKDAGKAGLYQSSLVLIRKGWIVSFTFIDANEDAVEELIEKLSFAGAAPRAK
jgi:hypothetical protein